MVVENKHIPWAVGIVLMACYGVVSTFWDFAFDRLTQDPVVIAAIQTQLNTIDNIKIPMIDKRIDNLDTQTSRRIENLQATVTSSLENLSNIIKQQTTQMNSSQIIDAQVIERQNNILEKIEKLSNKVDRVIDSQSGVRSWPIPREEENGNARTR